MAATVVFGGSGFLGRRVVRRLADGGVEVRVAVRHPETARNAFAAGRVTVQRADIRDRGSVAAALDGAHAVVNAVSAYVEKRGVTFDAVHVQGARVLAEEASAAGIARLVLVSGLGADRESRSPYIRARGLGEDAVRKAFPRATVVRPSAMFGEGDALFGTLARIVRLSPVLPLIGARTRIQIVHVENIAEAIARILSNDAAAGQTYELAGPSVYTMREIAQFVQRTLDRRRVVIDIPLPIASLQAHLFELLPNPPLTTGQVDLLKEDNVASGALPGLRSLGIDPDPIERIVPGYLRRS